MTDSEAQELHAAVNTWGDAALGRESRVIALHRVINAALTASKRIEDLEEDNFNLRCEISEANSRCS